MTRDQIGRNCAWLLLIASCGGSGATPQDDAVGLGKGTISGTIKGHAFRTAASVFWIGKPDRGALPTQVYVSDAALDCEGVSGAGWDKLVGDNQILEIDLNGSSAMTYAIGSDADANYVGGSYNPSADDGGTIVVDTIETGKHIVGSFELAFASEALTGTFDAPFCAEGVEP
jgi:hypothetical protein